MPSNACNRCQKRRNASTIYALKGAVNEMAVMPLTVSNKGTQTCSRASPNTCCNAAVSAVLMVLVQKSTGAQVQFYCLLMIWGFVKHRWGNRRPRRSWWRAR